MDNHSGMIAALKSNDTILMSILTIIYGSNNHEVIEKFLYQKNKDGETIIKIVVAHESDLSIHCELLRRMEKNVQCDSNQSQDQWSKDNICPTIVITIKNEKNLRNVLEVCKWNEYSEESKKIIFHYICGKNFNECLHYIKRIISFKSFLKLILSSGKYEYDSHSHYFSYNLFCKLTNVISCKKPGEHDCILNKFTFNYRTI